VARSGPQLEARRRGGRRPFLWSRSCPDFIALGQIPIEAGLWPLVVSRAVSVVAIAALAAASRTSPRLPIGSAAQAAAVGTIGTTATVLYMLATREELLTVAVVLTSLYPAITVLLACVFLQERISAAQAVGLGCAGAAVSLIALG
jgi:drug/metabolite transporter (DMT)-like permease